MRREQRALLTLIPSLMFGCLNLMVGWLPFPQTTFVKILFGIGTLYYTWIWVDWLEREKTCLEKKKIPHTEDGCKFHSS